MLLGKNAFLIANVCTKGNAATTIISKFIKKEMQPLP